MEVETVMQTYLLGLALCDILCAYLIEIRYFDSLLIPSTRAEIQILKGLYFRIITNNLVRHIWRGRKFCSVADAIIIHNVPFKIKVND